MKTLLKLQSLKSLWIPKSSCRLFHKQPKLLAPEPFSQNESIRQGEQQVPEYFNFASDVLDKWSQMEKDGKRSSNPAFWWVNGRGNEVRWSFEELGFHSRKVANVLSDICGLQKGDRVMLILPRIPEWWLVNVACMRTGISLILGTSQLTAKDISYRLQACKAKCIITNDMVASAVDAFASDCQFLKTKLIVSEGRRDGWLNFNELYKAQPADHICVKTKIQDPMVIYFTSGSTGSPKMAEHSQGSLGFRPVISERYWLDLTPEDMMWCLSDTGWIIASLGSVLDPWVFGSCVFVHSLPQVESTTILNTLSRFPITTIFGAPTLFRMLVQHDLTSSKFMSLQHCVSGGEPLNPEVMEQWKRTTGLTICEIYGQTETGIVCSVFKGMKIKPGSMGKAVPLYDVQIIDENANVLPPGQEGEIAIRIKPKRPLGLFSKYIDNPEKTASSERGNYFVTGDRGTMDEEGYFWFLGRSDDVINSSGYRIGPSEVENALIEHPAVVESAAVSSPDPLRGEVVKAFVVLSPAFSSCDLEKLTLELQEHVKKVTAPYKYPRKMEFVQQLPKTITGKIKRNELRNKEWGRILSQDFSTIFGAPTLFRMLVQHDLTSSKFMNLQHCVSGGEPLNPEVMEQWKRTTGLTICEVYGQTETGIVCSVFKGMKIKPGSMAKAVPLYDVQIIDENANVLPPGQEGEIAIRIKPKRPLGLFSKYIDNPEKTASSERGNYFVTGDRGTMDEEGYFWFLGRSDDVINSSGYRIGPSEVENALIEHPAVVESASSILLIGASSRVPS